MDQGIYQLLMIGISSALGLLVTFAMWILNKLSNSIDNLTETTQKLSNLVTAQEQHNADQDRRLDGHDSEIQNINQRCFAVHKK